MSGDNLGMLPYSKDNIVTEYGSWGFDFQRWQTEIILINQLSFQVNSAIVPKYQDLVSYYAAIHVFYDELSPIIAEKYPPAVEEMEEKLKKIKAFKDDIEKNKGFGKKFTSKSSLEMREILNALKHNLYVAKLKAGLGVPLKRILDNKERFQKASVKQ